MTKVVREITCSHCGAPLEFEPGDIIVTCRYCGFTCVIETYEAFTLEHSMIVSRYNIKQVKGLVLEWMASGFLKPRDLAKRSNMVEISLTYLPFWIVPVKARSYYKGIFERIGPGVVKEGSIEKEYDWLVLARKASDFPTREYDLPLEGKIPYDFRKIQAGAKVLNSEIDEAQAVEVAKQQIRFLHEYLAKQDVDKIIEMKIDFTTVDAVYLHVPIWFIAYVYKDNRYHIILDGVAGKVIKGDIPPSEFKLF